MFNFEHTKNILINFLVTTPIHGFRYLHEGRSFLEKLIWMLVIGSSFGLSFLMIQANLMEAQSNPILTTIDTTEITNVPFPAITVASNKNVDPWGFSEKFFNALAFYDPTDTSNPSVYEKSKDLRSRFDFLMEKTFGEMGKSLTYSSINWTLAEFKHYGMYNSESFIRSNYDKLAKIATKLAAISLRNAEAFEDTTSKINTVFRDYFFKVVSYKMHPFLDEMKTIVDNGWTFSETLNF